LRHTDELSQSHICVSRLLDKTVSSYKMLSVSWGIPLFFAQTIMNHHSLTDALFNAYWWHWYCATPVDDAV